MSNPFLQKITVLDDCLTVKQLKELIKDWPENDENGDPTEVWIMVAPCVSSPVQQVSPLNALYDTDGSIRSASIVLGAKSEP
jgi:hypothetical protein